jgi:A/G-specific adenine glycosylase
MQGLAYYLRFVQRFPDVRSLAIAKQEEVLKYWQGLDYYSRARNLHETALLIQEKYQGVFPSRYEDVLALKGVGTYTAAAIVSLAWNQPYPVIDGNVFRVLGRLFAVDTPIDTGKGKKIYGELATLLMNPQHAGLHNQALMEFGSLLCVPQKPNCNVCPLKDRCLGFASGNPSQFPVKQNIIKVRERFFNYLLILFKGHTYLSRRTKKDIWQGLFELPLIETNHSMELEALMDTDEFNQLFRNAGKLSITVLNQKGIKHTLSHQIIYAKLYQIEVEQDSSFLNRYLKVSLDTVDDYAFPRLIHRFFSDYSE